MTYPDGRHAERPTGTARPYLQDRQQWSDQDRQTWAEETESGRLREPDRQNGWLGDFHRRTDPQAEGPNWLGEPDFAGRPDRSGPPMEAGRQRWPGEAAADQEPWIPRQRPPVDTPRGAYPENDWLSPPRTGWGHPGPAPEPREPASKPVSFTAGEEAGLPALLRGRALDRLIAVNASHASHAADKVRTKDDLCEHVLALFSFDLTDKTYPLSTATRLSLSDDANSDLVAMLTSLANVAEHKVAQAAAHGRRWDPRIPLTGLVNRSEDLPPTMVYLGLGVSTLDTPEMTWRSMKGSVDRFSGLHLRGQGYLYLDDNTAAHFLRSAQLGPHTGQHEIASTNMLYSHYVWKRRPDLLEHANQRTRQVWEQIRRLHQALKMATAR